jgi:hypothetical protein
MKPISSVVNHRSLTFTQYMLLVAISVTASALLCTQPARAQTDGEFTPGMPIDEYSSPMASDPGDSWNTIPPSLADPALAPAPKESVEPPLPQLDEEFMSRVNGAPVESWNDPARPYLQPMVVSRPNSTGMPGDGLFSTLP